MPTVPRLSTEDVKAVFDCVYNKKPLPSHLKFHVVHMDESDSTLLPLHVALQDGLYVFCDTTRLPAHLRPHVLKKLPKEECHWSMAGPRFPGNNVDYQLRPCGPREMTPTYCKRGDIWTRCKNGDDEMKYRLFHVFPYVPKKFQHEEPPPVLYPHLALDLVKEVFDNFRGGQPPPPHLPYQVAFLEHPQRLAPPPLAFEDGLYILMKRPDDVSPFSNYLLPKSRKPQRQFRNSRTEKPQHFEGETFIMRSCLPTAGNQRADMWTLHGSDKQENLELRLLHVYALEMLRQRPRAVEVPVKKQSASSKRKAAESKVEKTVITTATKKKPNPLSPHRLTDDDVVAIFKSIRSKSAPPRKLSLQVVPPETIDADLRPPSVAFDDGIYILLKPKTKPRKVPSHLKKYVMEQVPSKPCVWKLGGPRRLMDLPTCQIRTCAPEHGHKRGDLWTMLNKDGTENHDYRIFHVHQGIPGSSQKKKAASPKAAPQPEGCMTCGKDDDYDKLLICETCERECHTYCAGFGEQVPDGDWFCDKCAARKRPARVVPAGSKKRPRTSTRVSSDESDLSSVSVSPPKHIYCKLSRRKMDSSGKETEERLGFVRLESHEATFSDARRAIQEEMDPESLPGEDWKFYLPPIGPVSRKQEESLGSVSSFLRREFDGRLGDGRLASPFRLVLLV